MILVKNIVLLIFLIVIISGCQTVEKIGSVRTLEESESTGLVQVKTTPNDADIFIDGVYKGKSPMILDNISAGNHNIVIKKEGYRDAISKFVVLEGEIAGIFVTFARISSETKDTLKLPSPTEFD